MSSVNWIVQKMYGFCENLDTPVQQTICCRNSAKNLELFSSSSHAMHISDMLPQGLCPL